VVRVLALDLERTLVSDALTAIPRPGLADFLQRCLERFGRMALFTTVDEPTAREVLDDLAGRGHVPPEMLERVEYVEWHGEFKDLRFVLDARPEEVLLIDDDASWIRPDQTSQWLAIPPWDGSGQDSELERIWRELDARSGG
jgi:hypothetical protein